MSEKTIRQWSRIFKDGQTNVPDEKRSVRPSVVSDGLQSIDQKICERWRFTISALQCEFLQISRTVFFEIIIAGLGCYKFSTRLVPKMRVLKGAQKMQRMASALTVLERYHKDGDEILSHIVRVTGDETWVSFVNVETKVKSKQWLHTHSPNKSKTFKQMSARKLMVTVEFMQKRTTIAPEVYCETLKNCVGPFRTKGEEC
jgi:hypothetical protein